MAINVDNITLTQVHGGMPDPAPGCYTIYYAGTIDDWKVSADVTAYFISVGIHVGDALIMRFQTVTGALLKDNIAIVTGTDVAMVVSIAEVVALA